MQMLRNLMVLVLMGGLSIIGFHSEAQTPPCIPQVPNLTIAGPSYFVKSGQEIDLLIGLMNQDSSDCPARDFNMVSCFGDNLGTYHLAPGQFAQTTWRVLSPASDGIYYRNVTALSDIPSTLQKASMSFMVDSTPPAGPAPLTYRVRSRKYYDFTWGLGTDTGSGFKYYKFFRDGLLLTTTTTPKYTDQPLVKKMYVYTVQSFDQVGNMSATSVGVSVP